MSIQVTSVESLVSSLSPQEKRHIRLYLTRQGKSGKEYLKLYDYYNSITSENSVGKKKQVNKPGLPAQSSNLYRIVLKALRIYHEERTVDISLYESLINAALLYEKRLYDLSLRKLDNAYELAYKNERAAIVLSILSLKADVIIEKSSKEIMNELEAVNVAVIKTIHFLEELANVKSTQLKVYALCRINYYQRTPEKIEEINQLIRAKEFKLPKNESLLGNHYHLMALAGHAYFLGNYDKAFSCYQELIDFWDRRPDRIKAEQLMYTRFLGNVMTSSHASGRFELIPIILQKLKKLPVHNAEEEAERFQNMKYIELLHLMNTDGYDRLALLTEQIEVGLNKYKTKVNKARELAFYHNLCMAWFLIHKWDKALDWNKRIINQTKTEHRLDLQRAARLFRLILWFEIGKFDLLDYELINVERYLRSHKAWFKYEATVIKFFRKLIQIDVDEMEVLLQDFHYRLTEVTKRQTSAALPCCSELLYWIKNRCVNFC